MRSFGAQRPRAGSVRRLLALAALVSAAGAVEAVARDAGITWKPGSAIRDAGDRAVADAWMKQQYYCQNSAERCNDFEFAAIRLGSTTGDALALRTDSGGTCGTYEVAMFAPAVAGDHKPADKPVFADCVSELILRERASWPDLVASATGGPSSIVTAVWRWTGKGYRVIRRSREEIR